MKVSKRSDLICNLNIFVTGVMIGGAMTFYIARMYRVYKFYSLYEMVLITKANATK